MQPQHISNVAHRLEAQALIEDTGNYVDDDIPYIMDVYDELAKHIGWEDNRRDPRFIVKFHDVIYYTPDEIGYDSLFEMFCAETYDNVTDELAELGINTDKHLMFLALGHYRAFKIKMPRIDRDNIVRLATDFYDEYNCEAKDRVKEHLQIVDVLQNLEDTYFEQWCEFLDVNEYATPAQLKEMKDKYNKDHPNNQIK